MRELYDFEKRIIIDFVKTHPLFQDFDFNTISKIYLFESDKDNKNVYGRVEPLSSNPLTFKVLLCSNILMTFQKSNRSKSVVLHEFCHCYEIVTTSNLFDFYEKYKRPQCDTRQIIFATAIECWGEYFAYYFSAKFHEESFNLNSQIKALYTYKKALSTCYKHNEEVPYTDDLWNTLIALIRKTVFLVACYNSTKEIKYAEQLHLFNSISQKTLFDDYFSDITNYFTELYNTYPIWVSEEKYIEIGRKLFSVIKCIDLDFSTPDLSDSGVLKYVPNRYATNP